MAIKQYKPKSSTLNIKNVNLRQGMFLKDLFNKDIEKIKLKHKWTNNGQLATSIGMAKNSSSQISNLKMGMYDVRKVVFEKLCNEHNLNPNKYFGPEVENEIYKMLNNANKKGITDDEIANYFNISPYQITNARQNKTFIPDIPENDLKKVIQYLCNLNKIKEKYNF